MLPQTPTDVWSLVTGRGAGFFADIGLYTRTHLWPSNWKPARAITDPAYWLEVSLSVSNPRIMLMKQHCPEYLLIGITRTDIRR